MSLWNCEYYEGSLGGLTGVDIQDHKCTWSNESIKALYTPTVEYNTQKSTVLKPQGIDWPLNTRK